MKTRADAPSPAEAAAIVAATAGEPGPDALAPEQALAAARNCAQQLHSGRLLETGEDAWSHGEGVAGILKSLGAAEPLQAAAYLVYAGDFLQDPVETIGRRFGPSYAGLVELTRKLVSIQRAAREASLEAEQRAQQTERVRKMLLAFSRDLRVVLLRLASRLQTLRWHAATKTPCPPALARESLEVFAPLANRLAIGRIKWEIEDLAFRFSQPQAYQAIAAHLDQSRTARELGVDFVRHQLAGELRRAGIEAEVAGRPKHLYSIWKKMQGKRLAFEQVLDVRALRVVVADVPACYAALSAVHARYTPVAGAFDDYIARPKPNGYQSLHTAVLGDDGQPVEVQIRTAQMHAHAEHGVAAHWAYKEAGAKGYAGVAAPQDAAERTAQARRAVMQQLLAWERDLSAQQGPAGEDRIYVLTPQSTVVDLPAGATPVDFAYHLHSDLGHRCRGARVDGALVPLNTPLANGQTVEIVATKEGGPSLDWLNPELGFLRSPRGRAKVRAWFNAQAQAQTIAKGREAVERLLQREGRTAVKHADLAERAGFKNAEALFEVVGKDEFSLKHIEVLLKPAEPAPPPQPQDEVLLRRSKAGDSGVLVVGVESLMTSLARCCRPAPPDAIGGFVTRGRGVAIHRADCPNFRHMAAQTPDRVIPVAWGQAGVDALFPVDLSIEALDRQGLLRDISEVFTRERVNVTGVKTQTVRSNTGDRAWMTFTVEVADASRLAQVLRQVAAVPGVQHARRK